MKKIVSLLLVLASVVALVAGASPSQTVDAACGGPFCIYDRNRLDVDMSVGETRVFYYEQNLSYGGQSGLNYCSDPEYRFDFLNIEAVNVDALGGNYVASNGTVVNSRPSMVTISPNKMSNVCNNGYPSFSITAREEGIALIEVAHATWNGYSPNRADSLGDGNYVSPDYLIQVKITAGSSSSKPMAPDTITSRPMAPDTTSSENPYYPSTTVPNTTSGKPSNSQNNTPASSTTTTSPSSTSQSVAFDQVRLNDLKTQIELIQKLLDNLKGDEDFPIAIEDVSVLVKESLALLQTSNKTIMIVELDNKKDKMLYEWRFNGKDVDATRDFDFKVNFNSPYQDKITEQVKSVAGADVEVTYLSFAQNGAFPVSTEVTIGANAANGNTVHLYNYDEETNQIEVIKENIPVVNEQVKLPITRGSKGYVVTSTRLNIATEANDDNVDADENSGEKVGLNMPIIITLGVSGALVVGLLVGGGFWLIKLKKFNVKGKTNEKH